MKHDLYMKAYIKEISQFIEAVNAGETPDTSPIVKKMVHYGVKAVITAPEPTNRLNNANDNFTFANGVKELMATLTPNEFMTLFPIEKDYKGHRWGFKDYFYTKKYMATLEPDTPIGDEILELLWEYHNWDIAEFVVRSMSCISDLRRLDGQSTFMDDFVETMDIDTLSLYTDDQGKQFIVDKYGRTSRVAKPRPRHLKLIK